MMDEGTTPQLKPEFELIILAQKPREGTFIENKIKHDVGLMYPKQSVVGKGFPGNVIEIPKVKENKKYNHPTVKPVLLMRQLINLFSLEGQIILDPFMGTGTTGVAALQDNRKFIGFEVDNGYFTTAIQRLNDEKELV